MQIQVSLHTSDYRGDHSADVIIAYETHEGETVEQLVKRLLFNGTSPNVADHIELRVVAEVGL